ncbi:J domain-containing protein [uncultured Amnibacterium sp.]|uniref:J domain-containing protein n=1 Tax=uncultured Amnibacterium sp. TaxID=1631851 RepID=UPI0035CC1C9D
MTGAAAPLSRSEAAALLEVQEDATAAEVQRAYLRAARRTHPDALPEADDATRRAASLAFDRLTRARDLLVTTTQGSAPPASRAEPEWRPGPEGPDGPRYRQVAGRGLGGSFVVLALLAFLLIAIVSAEQAFRGSAFDLPASPAVTSGP